MQKEEGMRKDKNIIPKINKIRLTSKRKKTISLSPYYNKIELQLHQTNFQKKLCNLMFLYINKENLHMNELLELGS